MFQILALTIYRTKLIIIHSAEQGENPLWDYFKISNEGVSKTVCILCEKNLSKRSKDPHEVTTTATNFCRNFGFGTSLI